LSVHITFQSVLTMNTGTPAQDQQNFFRTSKNFQILFRTL
jgi:hypothetical protein